MHSQSAISRVHTHQTIDSEESTPSIRRNAGPGRTTIDLRVLDGSVPELDLQVVIPAMNEELRIGSTIEGLCAHLASRPWRSGLIVVDNGSVDATAEVVDLNHKDRLDVEVIGCRHRGKGAAVREGILHSRARWVVYCDADLATPPEAIDQAIELLNDGWDIVLGSRRCVGGRYVVPQPALRRYGGHVFHALARRMVGPVSASQVISDTQCGFKAFQQDSARRLFASSRVHGFAFDIEILARAARCGMRMIELPVAWTDQKGSTLRPWSDGIKAVRDLLEVEKILAESPIDNAR